MIRPVDPSGLMVNAMGRMPADSGIVQASVSVAVSTMLIVFSGIRPATAHRPSGVT
ncbi:MAG: hypothetical protein R2708_17380 [Vicinamibacterales bacterium]